LHSGVTALLSALHTGRPRLALLALARGDVATDLGAGRGAAQRGLPAAGPACLPACLPACVPAATSRSRKYCG